jgi:hypothetical protein
MRNIYFDRVKTTLDELGKNLQTKYQNPNLDKLRDFCNTINTTCNYARQAVSPAPAGYTGSGENEPAYLKEEILFIHLLDEMLSSCVFLTTRLNTIQVLLQYKKKISALPRHKDIEKGYISKILAVIDEGQKTEAEEIKHLIALIKKRVRLASRIFTTFKKTN